MLNVQQENTGRESVLGFSLNGSLDEKDYAFINEVMEKQVASGYSISAFFEINNWTGITLKGVLHDLKLSIKYYSTIEKIVIIADEKWQKIVRFSDFVSPGIEIELFYPNEKAEAIEWLRPYHE